MLPLNVLTNYLIYFFFSDILNLSDRAKLITAEYEYHHVPSSLVFSDKPYILSLGRIIEPLRVGRDLQRPSSPTPCDKQGQKKLVTQKY